MPRARSSILQIPLTPRCKLELWTFQPSLAPEGGVARGNLVLSLVSNKKKSPFQVIFHCCQVMDVYFYVCQKTEQLKKHSPFGNIKLKNGEQTPSTGGSLQKHHSRPRSFIPRCLQIKQAHSKPTARENIWFKMLILNNFMIHNVIRHKVFVGQFYSIWWMNSFSFPLLRNEDKQSFLLGCQELVTWMCSSAGLWLTPWRDLTLDNRWVSAVGRHDLLLLISCVL